MRVALAALLLAGAGPVAAEDFDYYLLALSWSPSWCLTDGAPDHPQCDPDRDLGFILHGLWPQYEEGGWPQDCDTDARDPSRRETGAMRDVMGDGGLAWYQWKKHGRCTGLDPADYFADARAAFAGVTQPRLGGMPVSATALRAAFLALNPGIPPDGVVVVCQGGRLDEVRLCLDRDLDPRSCGRDVLDDACRVSRPLEVPPIP